MRVGFRVSLLLGLFSVACGGGGPDSAGVADCAAPCAEGAPCVLDRSTPCEFSDPSPWLLFDALLGELLYPEPGTQTAIFAFPSALAESVTPLEISEGAFDDQFWLSWTQQWSPDGGVLVFDVANNFFEPGYLSRLFFVEFGSGLPSPARPIENLPNDISLYPEEWDASSSAFAIEDLGRLYVVHREAGGLRATLAASSGVVSHAVCSGGKHVVYGTEQGVVFIAPADLLEGQGRVYDAYDYEVSPDGRWVVLVTEQDAAKETYSLELVPCGPEGEAVPMGDWSGPLFLRFSPDSKYLVLEGVAPLTYFDLEMPGEPRMFPADVTALRDWVADAGYALLGTLAGELMSFQLETGEQQMFPFLDESWSLLGDVVMQEEVDDEDEVSSFRLIDPRAPGEVLFELDLDGATLESVAVDPGGARLAYVLSDPAGSHARIVELRKGGSVTSFEFPQTFELNLGSFSGDGRGILAATTGPRFELYWLPAYLPGGVAEPRLIHDAEGGDLFTPQPWP